MVCSPYCLGQQRADVNGLDLAALLLVDVLHYCIGHQNLQRYRVVGIEAVVGIGGGRHRITISRETATCILYG